MDNSASERTATDDRIEENRSPAPVASVTREADATGPDGLVPGQAEDQRSPLDPVFYDPKKTV